MASTRDASRRVLLAGLAVAPFALAGCLRGSDPVAGASHPALLPPRGHAVVAMIDVSGDQAAAKAAMYGLAARMRAASGRAMVAIGGSWFAKAGVADRRPPGASPMPAFPGDLLQPGLTDSDLLVQVEGDSPAEAAERLSSLVTGLAGVTVRWRIAGERPGNVVRDGRTLSRNGFEFTEGFGNHDLRDGPGADELTLIRARDGVPGWAVGGTYLALRVIRLSPELWDPEPRPLQERIIGRRADGRWLDGTSTIGEPAFGDDPEGRTTPLDSHVRRANPRTPGSEPKLIRRPWNYDNGVMAGGIRDVGVLFMCYQADLDAGFTTVQRRLAGQALDSYILTVGGGFYVVPPHRDGERWEETLE
jgi:deferrochelatase/peroxidase EfeB